MIENKNIGDVYKCKEDFNDYVWNGTEWINIGQNTDFNEVLESIEQNKKELDESILALKKAIENTTKSIQEIHTPISSSGENLILEGTADENFKKFKVLGNSEQETRKGINLTDYKDWTRISAVGALTMEENTLIYNVVKDCYGVTDIERTLKPNTAYTAYADYEFNGKLGSQWGMRVKINQTSGMPTNSGIANFTTDESGIIRLTFYIDFPYNAETGAVLKLKNIRLYEGTYTVETIPEYEKFGIMPSPNYQSAIRNCGDSGNINFIIDNNLELTDSNYQSQNFTFPLKEGQRLYKGSYLAYDGIHHKRKQTVYDGTENWKIVGASGAVSGSIQFYIDKPSGMKQIDFCSHLKARKVINGLSLGNYLNIYIATEVGITTLEQLKTFLAQQKTAETPVIIEYEMEEYIEPYSSEQKAVYEEIERIARGYKGTTHIYCTDEVGCSFEVEAMKDVELLLNNFSL